MTRNILKHNARHDCTPFRIGVVLCSNPGSYITTEWHMFFLGKFDERNNEMLECPYGPILNKLVLGFQPAKNIEK